MPNGETGIAVPIADMAPDVVRAAGANGPLIVVSNAAQEVDVPAFLEALRELRGDVRHYVGDVPLIVLLRDVVADDPLTRMYELVTLRATRHGRLRLEATPLFPVGTQRGASARLTLRFTGTQTEPTVLAVVATSPGERLFQPVTLLSAPVPPAIYTLGAELLRPGMVRFTGLPAPLTRDQRRWSELMDRIPARLVPPERPPTEHLICAVETSTPNSDPGRLAERVARVRQLIAGRLDTPGRLRVSILGYGPHLFERGVPEPDISVLCWSEVPEIALGRLDRLAALSPGGNSYPKAAQLECLLAEIASRLERADEPSPVALLVLGDRPPFPSRVSASEILPCPRRNDWQQILDFLRHVNVTAICSGGDATIGGFWHEFTDGRVFDLEAVDFPGLHAALGLSTAVRGLPLPLAETE